MKKKYIFEERVYRFPESIEVERLRTGKPQDRGKRIKRKKPTPEQMRYQNQYNKEKHVRRLIKANFGVNDYWMTLTYVGGHKMDIRQAVKDRAKLLKAVRKSYAKAGYRLKWIGRTERGKRGAVHHHLIVNRIPDTDVIVSGAWKRIPDAGHAKMSLMYERGQFKDLAAYLVKPDEEDQEGNPATESHYSHSRGLKIPEPEIKRTTRKKILDDPVPEPGYYIDKDSICQGINSITGREYLHYIMIKKGAG